MFLQGVFLEFAFGVEYVATDRALVVSGHGSALGVPTQKTAALARKPKADTGGDASGDDAAPAPTRNAFAPSAPTPGMASTAVALVGFAASAALFWYVRRDARAKGVPRPLAWAVVAGGTAAAGVSLYAFVPAAPMTGVIMTGNTGLVLYGFEREVVLEDDGPAEPGELPGDPGSNGE